jgi:ectoine hydroxylase-related dioxygenase (phytanoyl-CoA dioxygenase family)
MDIKKQLDAKGYAIIPNVISPEQVEIAKKLFRGWQATIPDHDKIHSKVDPHGIYKQHYAGHTKHAWFLRLLPEVQAIYKKMWDCKKLITSFDGCCYISKDLTKKDNCWTHTDQAPSTKGVKCYQGFLALTSNKERTLVVYEGSHKLHEKYFADRGNTSTKNWYKIDPAYLETIKDTKRVLNVPAGSLVLWESRTFHQNQYGKPNSEERMIQYICMFPDNHPKNTKAMKKKRLKYFNDRRTTSHWPCPINVNGLQPQTFGDKSRLIDYARVVKYDFTDMHDEIMKLL